MRILVYRLTATEETVITDSFDDWQEACDYVDFLNWHPNNRAVASSDRFEVRGEGRSYAPPLPSPWHRRESLLTRTG